MSFSIAALPRFSAQPQAAGSQNPAISVPAGGFPVNLAPAADQFTAQTVSILTNGSLSPTGQPNSNFPVYITPDGAVITNTLTGRQKIGQLTPNGNFALANGQTGSIFQDEVLRVAYEYGDHPFLAALRSAERQRAVAGSEIPSLRNRMNALGLSGQGIKVAIIDPYEKIEDKKENQSAPQPNASRWKISSHSEAVQDIINNPLWGTAPGAQVIQLASAPSDSIDPKNDNVMELISLLSEEVCGVLNRGSSQLQLAMQMNDPSLRVVSMTWGTTPALLYNTILSLLSEKDDDQNFKYPKLRSAILGQSQSGTIQDRFQAVIQFVEQQIMRNPQVQQAQQQYLQTTQQAAQSGIIPVVSMANDRNMFKDAPPLPPGHAMNILAKSPFVIAAAASDTHQTPGDRSDDTIAPFSSPGDGQQHNPTVAAPGQEIGVGHSYGPHGRNMVINGTSFSTPFTCGVIALMLQANPNLTFNQIKTILQQTATPVTHSIADEGAGMMNPERAVQQALSTPGLQPPRSAMSPAFPIVPPLSPLPPLPSPV